MFYIKNSKTNPSNTKKDKHQLTSLVTQYHYTCVQKPYKLNNRASHATQTPNVSPGIQFCYELLLH